MDKLIPWRGTVVQLCFIAALLYFAHIAPEMHVTIMATLAGLGTLLTQRARTQAGSESGPGASSGDSSYPLAYRERDSDKPSKKVIAATPRTGVLAFLGLTWAAFAFFAILVLGLNHCGQPAATVATEVEAGISVAKGVCEVVGVATADPLVTLLCPFLDKNGQPVKNADGTSKKITVTIPRETWLAMKTRDGGQ